MLDGSVVVVDGTRGVEAQTVTVWKQLERFGVQRIIFLNKLDREKRMFEGSLQSIREVLNTTPVLLNYPVIDSQNQLASVEPIFYSEDHMLELAETLAELDDDFAESYLSHDCYVTKLRSEEVSSCIARLHQAGLVTPVCVGSGLSGVGISACLDHTLTYLPSPLRALSALPPQLQGELVGVVFKSSQDRNRGVLCQSRIYSGEMSPRCQLYNLRTRTVDRVANLYKVEADRAKLLARTGAGDIAMFSGCKSFRTGDVFVSADWAKDPELIESLSSNYKILKTPLNYGKPMFFCNIEPVSNHSFEKLKETITAMTFEDPTLVLEKGDGGELVLGGNGQLHLSITKERLIEEHGIDCKAYKFRVNYLETLTMPVEYAHEEAVGSMKIKIEPTTLDTLDITVRGVPVKIAEVVRAIAASCFTIGPLIGFRFSNCNVTISVKLASSELNSSEKLKTGEKRELAFLLKQGIRKAFLAHKNLLTVAEPFSAVHVEGPQAFASAIVADFATKVGGKDHEMEYSADETSFILRGRAPVSNLTDYLQRVRRISRGQAYVLKMEPDGYSPMDIEKCRETFETYKSTERG